MRSPDRNALTTVDIYRVIVIPGPGMPDVPSWICNDVNWPKRLAEEIDGNVQVSCYSYAVDLSSDTSSIQQLLAEGLKLLKCLERWLQGSVNYTSRDTAHMTSH